MSGKMIEKTDSGYVLRQRNAETAVALCLILFLGLILPFEVLVGWAEGEPKDRGFVIVAWSLFGACVLFGLFVLRSEWRRMVIDHKGIYFHRPLAKVKHVPWAEVRDWGILYGHAKYKHFYYLYFATQPLKSRRRGRGKKLPLTYGKAVYVHVDEEDLPELRRSGLISFCRLRLGENKKADRHPVPIFIADDVRG